MALMAKFSSRTIQRILLARVGQIQPLVPFATLDTMEQLDSAPMYQESRVVHLALRVHLALFKELHLVELVGVVEWVIRL